MDSRYYCYGGVIYNVCEDLKIFNRVFSLQATVIDALNELLTELESRCDILCILVHKLCAIFLCLSEGIAVVFSFGTVRVRKKEKKSQ